MSHPLDSSGVNNSKSEFTDRDGKNSRTRNSSSNKELSLNYSLKLEITTV